ncbi:MAG: sialate O-acetylesterase [Planctomycetota bacterium]
MAKLIRRHTEPFMIGLLIVVLLTGGRALAQPIQPETQEGLRLGAPFSDHMVFQAGAPVRIWGWDTPGSGVTVSLAGHEDAVTADDTGYWLVELPEVTEVGPHILRVEGSNTVTVTDAVAGEVWWCSGQSNMQWPVNRSWGQDWVLKMRPQSNIRLLRLPHTGSVRPQADLDVDWQISGPDTLPGFSAVAFYFAHTLQKELDRPVGVIQAAWGGSKIQAWLPPDVLDASPHRDRLVNRYAQAKTRFEQALADWEAGGRVGPRPLPRGGGPNQQPSGAANGMVKPFESMSIRGALWYQGESDIDITGIYGELFAELVASWRNTFRDPDLPVYFVQLPNFAKNQANWANFRNQQRLTALDLSGVDMAVTIDVGKADDIHPPNKLPVGKRLARLALHHTYGRDDMVAGSPRPVEVGPDPEDPRRVRVAFDRVGAGLHTGQAGGPPRTFVLVDRSGARKIADAEIEGKNKVMLSHPEITDPVAVRYANSAGPKVNLMNSEGLPATPFRIRIDSVSEPE